MAMPPPMATIEDYRSCLVQLKEKDQLKNDVIGHLIDDLEKTRIKCQEVSNDLEREQYACRSLQKDRRELASLIQRRGFIIVLIHAHGDHYMFLPRFLNSNAAGGKEAADELHSGIKDYLATLRLDCENTDIVVKIFADIKSVTAACLKTGGMTADKHYNLFVQGFNQRRSLFDMIDVGAGKREASQKLRECLDFNIDKFQCKHIILGAYRDSSDMLHLSRLASDASSRDRITFLEGSSKDTLMRAIGFPRTPLRLDSVFALREPIVATTPAAETSEHQSLSPATAMSRVQADRVYNPGALSDRLKPIHDGKGRRIDRGLDVDPDSPYLTTLKQTHLCARFFLRGHCYRDCKTSQNSPPLSARQFDCLWSLTRQTVCDKLQQAGGCKDPKCYWRHPKALQHVKPRSDSSETDVLRNAPKKPRLG